jgi:hypothetical protein
VELIEKDLKLKEQLKLFQSSFEQDEIVNIWNYGRKFFLVPFSLFVILLFFGKFSIKNNKIILLEIIELLIIDLWKLLLRITWSSICEN